MGRTIKKSAWLLMLLALQAAAFAQKVAKALDIAKLKEDFYVYTTYGSLDDGSRFPSNSMYIVTGAGVVMIDVPWDTTQMLPLLDTIERRHGQKVIACISTHFHADRTAGLDMLHARGIPTYAIERTRVLSRGREGRMPQHTLPEDTTFRAGRHRIRVFYPGPGHTTDNIVVWFPDDKVLYGGCFVKSTEAKDMGNLEDADTRQWPASVRKVQQAFPDAAYIIPGHGSWAGNHSLSHTLKLLRRDEAAGKKK